MDKRYEGCEYKEARLVQRGGRMFLHIAVRNPKPAQYEPRGVVAVDINDTVHLLRQLPPNRQGGDRRREGRAPA